MDPSLRNKLNKIAQQLNEQKRQSFERELNALLSRYTPQTNVPTTIANRFEKRKQLYNEFVKEEVEKRKDLLPNMTEEERYQKLRSLGVVPRREEREIEHFKGKNASLKASQLAKYMNKISTKKFMDARFARAKENLVIALAVSPATEEGAKIKKQIEKMTQEEWEAFIIRNPDLINRIWEHYHTEISTNRVNTMDFVNARHEVHRVLSNTLDTIYAERKRVKAANKKLMGN